MLWLVLVALIALLLVWELWVCEGAHLGRRVVVWLYDVAANRYDGIKQFDPDWERQFLGEPLERILSDLPHPILVDIGAGTARTFRSMDDLPGLGRALVGIEPSRRMMALGRGKVGAHHQWVQGLVVPLPLAPASVDVAVCLEVLEFTPNPSRSIGEILRVLRPGGWALLTNRIGWQAPLILGRTVPRDRFSDWLQERGFEAVEVFPWQVDYDIAWARKPWT